MRLGLQGLHDCQKAFLDEVGVDYEVQSDKFISNEKIENFIAKFDQILVHFDIDVLDEKFFHSKYFADPEVGGDGSGGGKMKFDQLSEILSLISQKLMWLALASLNICPLTHTKCIRCLIK